MGGWKPISLGKKEGKEAMMKWILKLTHYMGFLLLLNVRRGYTYRAEKISLFVVW